MKREFDHWLTENWNGTGTSLINASAHSQSLNAFSLLCEADEVVCGLTERCPDRVKNIKSFLIRFRSPGLICKPLVDVYLFGIFGPDLPTKAIQQRLVDLGFAGTSTSAQAITSVGKNTGNYFGLLEGRRITPFFRDYFGIM